MIAAITVSALWKALLWFIAHLQDICTVFGAFAIAVPIVDQGIRAMVAKHPHSRFWNRLDKIFFGCGVALVNIGKGLDQMLAKRREIQGS